jgi:hypothetical protein
MPTQDHFRLFASRLHHIGGLARQPLVVNLVVLPNVTRRSVHFVKFQHVAISCGQDSKFRASVC